MRRDAVLEHRAAAIADLCRAGHAPAALRDRVLARLRAAVPFDAAFWTTVDPVTLLFTAPHQEAIPPETVPYFVENELVGEDVNAFAALARDPAGVRSSTRPACAAAASSSRRSSANSTCRARWRAARWGARASSPASRAARPSPTRAG